MRRRKLHLVTVLLMLIGAVAVPQRAGAETESESEEPEAAKPGAIEFHGKLYPEWRIDRFGQPSNPGTEVGTLSTLRNDGSVLTRTPSPKAEIAGPEWSNSYIGIRGQREAGDLSLGFDLQAVIDLQGGAIDNFRARDAYAFVEHDALGRVSIGRMDTIYKLYGDRVRMFGVSSGNFIGTSRVGAGISWRGQGETTFHNRRSSTLAWQSPVWSGVQLGFSHSFDSGSVVAGNDDTLTALGARWRRGPWYFAIATEIHRNWLPLSLGSPGVIPAATSILNSPATARSRDQGVRLSAAWSQDGWRFATDIAQLRYTERDAPDLPGKFRSYATTTFQASVERRLSADWQLGLNHARGAAGTCRLSGEVACSTEGLGGHQTGLGAMRRVTPELSVFMLAQHVHNAPGARFASAPTGATVRSFALGIKYEFK